jgi:uncharacterized membrane protein YoaK (UPF0700 family)
MDFDPLNTKQVLSHLGISFDTEKSHQSALSAQVWSSVIAAAIGVALAVAQIKFASDSLILALLPVIWALVLVPPLIRLRWQRNERYVVPHRWASTAWAHVTERRPPEEDL